MLKRIKYLILLLVIFSCEKNNNKPNIVFILADDLGYGDLSSYGSKTIETTNIDKLAENGVKLTSYYAAQPVSIDSGIPAIEKGINQGYELID